MGLDNKAAVCFTIRAVQDARLQRFEDYIKSKRRIHSEQRAKPYNERMAITCSSAEMSQHKVNSRQGKTHMCLNIGVCIHTYTLRMRIKVTSNS